MWQYYLDVTKFGLAYYVISLLILSPVYAALSFGIFGTFVGLIGYNQFHKNEYYTYYNLGFTRKKLIIGTFIFNILLTVVLVGLGFLPQLFTDG